MKLWIYLHKLIYFLFALQVAINEVVYSQEFSTSLIVFASILLAKEILQIYLVRLSYFKDIQCVYLIGILFLLAAAMGFNHLSSISTILILNRGTMSALRMYSKTRYFVHMI
jgi:hypothetical protein